MSLSKFAKMQRTVSRRLRHEPRIWWFLFGEIVVYPILAAVLGWYYEHDKFAFILSALVLSLLFFLIFLVAVYRIPPAMEPEGTQHFLDDLLDDNRAELGGTGAVFKSVLQLPDSLVSVLDDGLVAFLPIVNPVDVASSLLNVRSKSLATSNTLRASAVHFIPPGRSEQYWWSTERAIEYLALQRRLIAEKHLAVQRLLIIPEWSKGADEDVFEWVAQAGAGIKVRWARLDPSTAGSATSDFLILEELDSSKNVVGTDLMLECRGSGALMPRVELITRSSPHLTERIEPMRRRFNGLWANSEALEIQKTDDAQKLIETFNKMRSENKVNPACVVAYFSAIAHIANAKICIFAVDISDLKEGLGAVYDDSTYKAWYEITISRAKNIGEFVRVFVLKRSPASLAELKKNHLQSYYDARGHAWPSSKIYVVFEDEVMAGIDAIQAEKHQLWLNARPAIRDYLVGIGVDVHDCRVAMRALLVRDFLVTEDMLYDYRSKTAKFDLSLLMECLVLPEKHGMELISEWPDVVHRLIELGNGISSRNLAEFERILDAAVATQPSPVAST